MTDLSVWAAAAPNAPALIDRTGGWNYGQLGRAIESTALGLQPLLQRVPSVVAGFFPRCREGVVALHAVPRAGGILAPLHVSWTPHELRDYLNRLQPSLVLFPRNFETFTRQVIQECPSVCLEELVPAEDGLAEPGSPPVLTGQPWDVGPPPDLPDTPEQSGARLPPAGTHSILATSGSDGHPRLVVLSLAGHLANAHASARRLCLSADDRWLSSLAFAHVGGLALAIRAAAVGSILILRDRFDPGEWNQLLVDGVVTHISLVPTMLRRLLEECGNRPAPPTLRCVLLGGAPTPRDLLERALELRYPIALTYGLTECSSQVATAPPDLVRRKPGTVGSPLAGIDIQLSDEGEILVRGPTLGLGLWDEPQTELLADGWLNTGDLGRLDEDGHLWVTGRRSGRILTGGVNVDPVEVEGVVATHPAVREVAVLGVADPHWGERVVAAVAPKREPGREPAHGEETRASDRLRADLEAHCRQHLSAAKRPKDWLFLTALPHTATGKPDPKALRCLFRKR